MREHNDKRCLNINKVEKMIKETEKYDLITDIIILTKSGNSIRANFVYDKESENDG